jgi:signal transduction histidine kinase
MALDDLHEAERLAGQVPDSVLTSMVHDFYGDLYLAEGERDRARHEFAAALSTARRGHGGSERAVAYAHYSLAKWVLSRVNPVREGLTADEHTQVQHHLELARTLFTQVNDLPALGMTLLLEAQSEMRTNLGRSAALLGEARRQLRRCGPRRHLALALFRSGEFVITNDDRLREVRPEDPVPYLRAALSMVRKLSMPERTVLFREGLRQLPVDAWIDMLMEFAGAHERGAESATEVENLRSALASICHDYKHLLHGVATKLNTLAADPAPDAKALLAVAAAVGVILADMHADVTTVSGQNELGVEVVCTGVDLPQALREAISLFGSVGRFHVQLRLPRGGVPTVQADKSLLRRVMLNLLLNAQCAMQTAVPPPLHPKITVAAAVWDRRPARSQFVEVTVRDTGAGLGREAAATLFVKGKSQFPGGQGLGLCFCQQAMRAMGGAVYVKDPGGSGKGATFGLRVGLAARGTHLPCKRTQPAAMSS